MGVIRPPFFLLRDTVATKRELIEAAFAELGVSNEFDVSPDELTQALGKLNRLMATWTGRNIRIGYNPGTDIEAESGLGDTNQDAVLMNLALRLAPGIGKIPHPDLKRDARLAYLALLTKNVNLIPVQLPREMVSGAGNRRFSDRNYISPPDDPAETGSGGVIDGVDFA